MDFEVTRLIRSYERSLAHRFVSEDDENQDGNVVEGMGEGADSSVCCCSYGACESDGGMRQWSVGLMII